MVTSTGSGSDERNGWAALAVGASALSYSSAPVLIHLTAEDTAPFLFNVFVVVSNVVVLGLFLGLTKKRFVDDFLGSGHGTSIAVTDAFHFSYLGRSGANNRVRIRTAHPRNPSTWLKTPLLWIIVSSLEFGFFVWSTRFVETGVASVVYELWPVIVLYGLARLQTTDTQFREQSDEPLSASRVMRPQHIGLTVCAVVGLVFMLGSQAPRDSVSSLSDIFGFSAVTGVFLALVASVLGALSVIGTLGYGRIMYYRLKEKHAVSSQEPVGEHGDNEGIVLLWLTALGIFVGRVVAVPILLLTAVAADSITEVSLYGLVGALIVGFAGTFGAILLRWGNIASAHPAVNVLSFMSPLLALVWLMTVGISLPRFDLFFIGAVLILAVNILIQLNPDQERDVAPFGKAPRSGSRLGFTVFILSIWTFGTFTYVRDELLPADQLIWNQEEYWGLIALSATVFALILGFRVARLSSRITHEDEMTFELFRECELLVGLKVLPDDTLEMLSDLDTAPPEKLRVSYNEIREQIRSAENADLEVKRSVASVAAKLDKLTHSKQQGRDIVELLSLTAFAVVTVGLGLLARPVELGVDRWEGFLSEVFILVFVSTVAFLCVNLFDIRRDRETPLVLPIQKLDGDYALWFRHKRYLTVERLTAVLISIGVSIAFCVLLYGKWL